MDSSPETVAHHCAQLMHRRVADAIAHLKRWELSVLAAEVAVEKGAPATVRLHLALEKAEDWIAAHAALKAAGFYCCREPAHRQRGVVISPRDSHLDFFLFVETRTA